MYMLDTNTCIYVLKNRTPALKKKFKAIKNMCISSITFGELCFVIEKGDSHLRAERYNQLDVFTQRILIDNWIEDAARHYGSIRASLQREGNIIGNNDLLIAAHARSINAVLVTNNTREFSRVHDLTVENWVS